LIHGPLAGMSRGMDEKFVRDAVMLWATIDPIGTLSLFVGLTAGMSHEQRRKVAVRATLVSAVILVGSVIVGQLILSILEIPLASFEVAGGIILFIFGLKMIFDDSMATSGSESNHDIAVFPLAVPSIASPGAIMAAVVLTDNNRFPVAAQAVTTGILLLVLGATCALMLFSLPISKVLGKSGASILIKVMGMLLCALAVEMALVGFRKAFLMP